MFEKENATVTNEVMSGAQEPVVEAQTETPTAEEFGKESRYEDFRIVGDGRERTVGVREETEADPKSEGGEAGGETRQPDGAGQAGGKSQSREENAAIRAARLRAEEETRAQERARLDEKIANSGAVNPISGKPFTSMEDFLAYGKQYREAAIKEKAEASGRSVEEVTEEEDDKDFIRNLRKKAQAEETPARPNAEESEAEFIRRDVQDFVQKFPKVDLAKLEANESFLKFCGSRFKREPLADLYGDFLAVVGGARDAAAVKAAERADRSTGGGVGGGGMMTPEQMSALEKWNRDNPELQMTAKEFLSR